MTVWDALDLRRHAVIEASAGTGKTYTIERIVVRLLRERDDIALDRLLVVTFTEKATGELKERVRALVEKALAEESDPRCRARLQAAADGFDTAAISTIHAFCARLLREYAFENRQPFDIRLGPEGELATAAVRDVLRRDAPKHFGAAFQDALRRAADGPTGRWADSLAELLSQYRGPPWDLLLEDGDTDPVAELTAALTALRSTFGPQADAPPAPGDWGRRYGLLNFHAGSRKAALPVVQALEGWFLDPAAAAMPAPSFLDTLDDLAGISWFDGKDRRFAALVPERWNKSGSNLDDVFPELPALAAALDALAPPVRRYRHALSLYVLKQARHELEQAKAREGLVTFDDLIRRLWEAVRPDNPDAEPFVAALRKRFQIAIVDEFQDTDPIQWRIFHRLFVEPPADGQLLVVGDPKQAIYAFRGADVRTYLHARDVLLSHNAQRQSLAVTYRCIPELIHAFNALFSIPGWFPDVPGGIGYEPVQEPPEGNPRLGVIADRTGRAAVVRVALDGRTEGAGEDAGKASADRLRIELAGFIADEIAALLADPDAFRRVDPADAGGDGRALRPEDLCILVQSRATAARIERALQRRRIPYTVYKQPGLYASDEADCILDMLRFLVRPADDSALRRVLLGPFFAVPATAIETHPGLADPHVQDLAGLLQFCCEHRQWGRLCDALLHDTGFWARAADTPDGERRLAAMRQILDELQATAGAEITDVAGLEERLLQLRDEAGSAETGLDLRRRDSDVGRVRVMTMHAAKGLEFPIVFIADGFAGSARVDTRNAFHWVPLPVSEPAGGALPDAPPRAISFEAGSAEVRAQQTADRQSEWERLYYVALTRAQYRLYLPWTDSELGAALQSSPLARLLMPALEALEQRHPELLATVPATAWHDQPRPAAPARPEAMSPDAMSPDAMSPEQDDALSLWIPADTMLRRLRLHSFSSLARHGEVRPEAWTALEVTGERSDEPPQTEPEAREGATADNDIADGPPEADAGPPEADEVPPEADAGPPEADEVPPKQPPLPSPLPPGNAVGKAFHDLLEALCEPPHAAAPAFETAQAATTAAAFYAAGGVAALADAALRRHAVTQPRGADQDPAAASRALAAMAWRALRTPLTPCGLRLCDVPRGDRRAEVEFHVAPAAALGVAAPAHGNALLTGFIDLVFRHNGRYYILDWKTNTLDRYSSDAVRSAMQECDYGLQYQLYTLTVREWLRTALPDFGEERLGGVFYCFVRGGPEGPEGPVAVFSEPWSADRLRHYREAVGRRMPGDAGIPAANYGRAP